MNIFAVAAIAATIISNFTNIEGLSHVRKNLKGNNHRRQHRYVSVKENSSGGNINQEIRTGSATIGGAKLESDGNSPPKSIKVTNKVQTFADTTDQYNKHNIPPPNYSDSASKTGGKSKSDSFSGTSSGLSMKNLEQLGSFAKEDKSIAFSMGYGGGGGIAFGNNSIAGGGGAGIGFGADYNARKQPRKSRQHLQRKQPRKSHQHLLKKSHQHLL